MGWLIVFLVAITCLCLVIGVFPSANVIKLLLMFVIGFVIIWAFIKLVDGIDKHD